jgi:hypothetical protein
VAVAAVVQADMFFLKEGDTKEYNKYLQTCIMSRDQQARQNHIVKKYNISFERMKEFSYLGTALTNGNSIHDVIKSRMKLENAFSLSVLNLLSSSLLSKNIKINPLKTKRICFI